MTNIKQLMSKAIYVIPIFKIVNGELWNLNWCVTTKDYLWTKSCPELWA